MIFPIILCEKIKQKQIWMPPGDEIRLALGISKTLESLSIKKLQVFISKQMPSPFYIV